ncbi:MAG TPA: M20/M25/M40 family metallo-hydrolase [Gaiellales bacterium]|nr:M20/M25/M40 family metallo-hydrolase [Gaiellales bacterium]
MEDTLLDELCDWLRIPSISSGGGDPADLRRAAEWAAERIAAAGGSSEVLSGYGNPLCVGELRSRRADAPTVLIYGHYDVQSPDPRDLWTSDPFDPVVRGGRVYARGASDDKGNFLPLLHVACELARSGELPVHVRVVLEGEEEVGGSNVVRYVERDERGADCAIVFDGGMVDASRPALHIAVRGVVMARVRVRTASRDLHSGVYGGVALNAAHVLMGVLGHVVAGSDGRLRDELRAGLRPPGAEEVASWAALPDGAEALAAAGAHEIAPGAAAELYARTWADTSLDVNGIESGDALQRRTIIPCTASARLTVRLALAQDGSEIAAALERILREAVPPGAELEIEIEPGDPAGFDAGDPVLALARTAIGRAVGTDALFVRTGGSIPILGAFAKLGIPTVLSGFALDSDGIHGPDESYRLESLALGERAARELYAALATLH